MTLLLYVVVFFLFSGCYILDITALILPKWLKFIVQDREHYSETTYGLFQRCESSTGECTSFPQPSDCKEDFCQLWQIVVAGVILAAFTGTLTMIALTGIIFSQRDKRGQGWKLVAGMLVLHAIPLVVSFSAVVYLSNSSSSIFHLGTGYDQSFVMSAVSWCLSVVLAFIMMGFSTSGNDSHYHRLE
ncbi:hypothetical protein V8B55DRAFT_1517508 [Mucor lusitanicus]|uniref:Uncharacterized protein n=2 Tax=Mucor circinelloides f. lusitanicus TaxID=29924 RepID=A0A162TAL6_MUCCL|nr:hypothetical protein FB192DRAFT_1399022 [Mucor lusitanicus]OAD03142.1 hypothetical protein MUCCIDRAFT_91619 [Mucor lusitanicus CBS 277.49]